MNSKRLPFLWVVITIGLNGCMGATTATWKSPWGKAREPVDPNLVILYYSPSDVPYKYVEVATCKVKAHVPNRKPAYIPRVKHFVGKLIVDAADKGAQGLILSTPDAPRFPAICFADNAKEEPLCEHLTALELVAIAPK